MKPTTEEYKGIVKAICAYLNQDEEELCTDKSRVCVLRDYMPDGPSWIGDMAFVVFGESCFTMILRNSGTDEDGWKVYRDIHENEMTTIVSSLNTYK